MPYKITNIAKHPIVILTTDGDKKIKHNLNPSEFVIMWFIPPTASQFHIRNLVTIDYITPNDVLPTPKKVETSDNQELKDDIEENNQKVSKKTKNSD